MAGHFQNNKLAWQAGMSLCSDPDQASVEDLICVGWFWCCKTSLGGPASLQTQSSCVRERTRRTWDISQTCNCETFTNHLNYGPHYSEPVSLQERYLSSREEKSQSRFQSIPLTDFVFPSVFKRRKKYLRSWEHLVRSLEIHEPKWAQSPPGQAKHKQTIQDAPSWNGAAG